MVCAAAKRMVERLDDFNRTSLKNDTDTGVYTCASRRKDPRVPQIARGLLGGRHGRAAGHL